MLKRIPVPIQLGVGIFVFMLGAGRFIGGASGNIDKGLMIGGFWGLFLGFTVGIAAYIRGH